MLFIEWIKAEILNDDYFKTREESSSTLEKDGMLNLSDSFEVLTSNKLNQFNYIIKISMLR